MGPRLGQEPHGAISGICTAPWLRGLVDLSIADVIIESRAGGEVRESGHSWGHSRKLRLLLRGFMAMQRGSGATEAFRTWG